MVWGGHNYASMEGVIVRMLIREVNVRVLAIEISSLSRVVRDGWDPCPESLSG